jgi:anti-sigma28 factor (negative regulator of flagellin synthesis)
MKVRDAFPTTPAPRVKGADAKAPPPRTQKSREGAAAQDAEDAQDAHAAREAHGKEHAVDVEAAAGAVGAEANAHAVRSAAVQRSVRDGSYKVDVNRLADALLDAAQLEARMRASLIGNQD